MSGNYKTVISGSVFKNLVVRKNITSTSYIYDQLSDQLEIIDSILDGSKFAGMSVYVKNCNALTIKNSSFSNFKTDNSGLTSISNSNGCKLTIKNSIITKNSSGKSGGGVYSENYNVTIIDTEISYNKAQISGGGIYFSSPFCSKCGLYLVGDTRIFNNSADIDCGAIKWKDFKP